MVGDTKDHHHRHVKKHQERVGNPAKAGNLAAQRNGAKMKFEPKLSPIDTVTHHGRPGA